VILRTAASGTEARHTYIEENIERSLLLSFYLQFDALGEGRFSFIALHQQITNMIAVSEKWYGLN